MTDARTEPQAEEPDAATSDVEEVPESQPEPKPKKAKSKKSKKAKTTKSEGPSERVAAQATPPPAIFSGPRPASEIGLLRSMRTHWFVVLATLVVFVAAGVAVALVRQPVYESQVSLNVSFTADSVATQPGAVSAAQDLAESYARSIYSTQLVNTVARKSDLSRDEVSSSVTATPVGDSTVLFVAAQGDSEREARALADTTAQALSDYVEGLSNARLSAPGLLDRYREASRRFEELEQERKDLDRNDDEAEVDIRAQLADVGLERDTYAQLYRGSQRGVVAPLEVLDDSRGATSDFLPRLQLLVLAGVIGGLLAGAAFASLRAARVRRKAAKQAELDPQSR